jgi:type IV pilus assembly protein PilV
MRYGFSIEKQQGASLLEALVAIFIFSIGILALVSLQAASIKNSIDAKYRSDASYLVNQIISQMWVDRTKIDSYAHYPDGDVCGPSTPFTGTASSYAKVSSWVAQVTRLLPGSASNRTQIQVSDVGTTKQVKVTVCWQGPQETVVHNFAATAQINP